MAPCKDIPPSELCSRCSSIDLKAVLRLTATELRARPQQGCFVANLGDKSGSAESITCALCRLFREGQHHVHVTSQSSTVQDLQLRAYSGYTKTLGQTFKRLPVRLLDQDIPHLAVVPSDSNAHPAFGAVASFVLCSSTIQTHHQLFQPQILSPEVQYETIIASLEFCKNRHKLLCGKIGCLTGPSRLIDCGVTPASVVQSPSGVPYIALSYVWGQHGKHTSIWGTNKAVPAEPIVIPSLHLPRTILDAQIVVRKLGYRYLWVDQICINQEDPDDKQSQIEIMDKIYGGAELTIVAAAGSHSDYGLPGVFSKMRPSTQSVELDGLRIIHMPNDPPSLIRSSTWCTRAWTHQEALLSRRLLFFTDSEAYFECHSMQARESLVWDFDTLHCKQGKLYSFFNSGLFLQGISHNDSYVRTPMSALIRFYNIVKDFTTRSMSHEEDALRAFMGIIAHLESYKIPVFQLQGVPFVTLPTTRSAPTTFLHSLLWVYVERSRPKPTSRRLKFPSWSWAGWKGQIEFIMESDELHHHLEPQGTIVGLKLNDNTEVDLTMLHTSPLEISHLPVLAIAMNARMLVLDSVAIHFTKAPPNCRIVSRVVPPVRPSHLNQPRPVPPSRRGRKPVLPRWLPAGSKAVIHLHKWPKFITRLTEFCTSNKLRFLLIGNAPRIPRLKGSGRIYFLILEPCGTSFSRMGVLEVKEDLESFSKFTRFEECVSLIS